MFSSMRYLSLLIQLGHVLICGLRGPQRGYQQLGRMRTEVGIPAILTASSSRMPTVGLKTCFLACLLGAEGKSQGAAEWTCSDPVPLHAVARHGSSGVRPPSADLREEVLGSPHAGDGACPGALQVRTARLGRQGLRACHCSDTELESSTPNWDHGDLWGLQEVTIVL